MAPRIAKEIESQAQAKRVTWVVNGLNAESLEFSGGRVDIVDAKGQVKPACDGMRFNQTLLTGAIRASRASNRLDAKVVVRCRRKEYKRFLAEWHRERDAKVQLFGIPSRHDVKSTIFDERNVFIVMFSDQRTVIFLTERRLS